MEEDTQVPLGVISYNTDLSLVEDTILAKDADHTPLQLVNTELEEIVNLAQGVSYLCY